MTFLTSVIHHVYLGVCILGLIKSPKPQTRIAASNSQPKCVLVWTSSSCDDDAGVQWTQGSMATLGIEGRVSGLFGEGVPSARPSFGQGAGVAWGLEHM